MGSVYLFVHNRFCIEEDENIDGWTTCDFRVDSILILDRFITFLKFKLHESHLSQNEMLYKFNYFFSLTKCESEYQNSRMMDPNRERYFLSSVWIVFYIFNLNVYNVHTQ